jgi:Baseplate J-like protein
MWRRRPTARELVKHSGPFQGSCFAPSFVEGEVVSIEDHYQPFTPPPKRKRRMPILLVALIAALGLALGAGTGMWISPIFFATATVTLTPETHALSTVASIPLTVRLFPADHESLSRTVATTGTAIRPATVGRGVITFYNGLPAPQTVPAGTLLMSANGMPVLTQEPAYIPAASPPTEGAVTVSAQAENTGPAGNIPAGSIGGPCCRAYVLAYSGAFWGGADVRTYRTPTTTDIATATTSLRTSIDSRVQSAIHAWLQPREVLLPPTCDARTGSSAQPGADADHVTVTVRETCTAAAYDEGALQRAATIQLGSLASRQFGDAYRLVSDVRTTLSGTTMGLDLVTLRLQLSGVYAYRFSARQLTQLRAQLAGMSRDRATVVLARMAGVTTARILSRDTLPNDPSRIQVLLSQ